MTGALDGRMRALAARMTAKFGKQITIRRVTVTVDHAMDTDTRTVTDQVVNAAPPESYESRLIDGSLVQAGDVRLTVPALGVAEPEAGLDQIVMDGETWGIVRVEPVWSGEQAAVYRLQVRK